MKRHRIVTPEDRTLHVHRRPWGRVNFRPLTRHRRLGACPWSPEQPRRGRSWRRAVELACAQQAHQGEDALLLWVNRAQLIGDEATRLGTQASASRVTHGIGLGDADLFVNKLASEMKEGGKTPSLLNLHAWISTDTLKMDKTPGE